MQHTKSTTSEVDTALIKSMIMFLDSNNNNHQPLFVVLILFLYTCFSMSNCMYVCTCATCALVPHVRMCHMCAGATCACLDPVSAKRLSGGPVAIFAKRLCRVLRGEESPPVC